MKRIYNYEREPNLSGFAKYGMNYYLNELLPNILNSIKPKETNSCLFTNKQYDEWVDDWKKF